MSSIKSYAKMGFGLGLGVFASQIIFILIGLALFLPGLMLIKKKDKNGEATTSYYAGIALMAVGVAIMGGFGLGILVDNIDF
jgi:uncharacterized membrane protein